jgi:hypothetical protein
VNVIVIWTFEAKFWTGPLASLALSSTALPTTCWPAGGVGARADWIWIAVG